MEITGKLLNALEVKVEPFAICDIRRGCYLNIEADNYNTIHYTLAGSGILMADGGAEIPLQTDQMILVPRGVRQRIESTRSKDQGSAESSIYLQPNKSLHWLKGGEGPTDIVLACGRIHVTYGQDVDIFNMLNEPLVEPFGDSAYIRGAFEEMLHEFGNPQLGTLALTSSLMKQCLIMLLRRLHSRQDRRIPWLAVLDNPRLEQALRVMFDEPNKKHRVEDLADQACMSRSSFSEYFMRTFGQPPHEFLTNYRLRQAAQMLSLGELPVGIIANRVGYQSRSSFSRAFKALYGNDPASYRKMAASG